MLQLRSQRNPGACPASARIEAADNFYPLAYRGKLWTRRPWCVPLTNPAESPPARPFGNSRVHKPGMV